MFTVNLPNKPFHPITLHKIVAGFIAYADAETIVIQAIGRRVHPNKRTPANSPLLVNALKLKWLKQAFFFCETAALHVKQ